MEEKASAKVTRAVWGMLNTGDDRIAVRSPSDFTKMTVIIVEACTTFWLTVVLSRRRQHRYPSRIRLHKHADKLVCLSWSTGTEQGARIVEIKRRSHVTTPSLRKFGKELYDRPSVTRDQPSDANGRCTRPNAVRALFRRRPLYQAAYPTPLPPTTLYRLPPPSSPPLKIPSTAF